MGLGNNFDTAPVKIYDKQEKNKGKSNMIAGRIKTLVFTTSTIHLMGLLIFVGYQNVYAQQQIAQDAYALFEQRCLICHGPEGAYKETLLIEHNALIANGTVIPGNPNTSELYNRLVTTDTAKRMPLQSTPAIRSSD